MQYYDFDSVISRSGTYSAKYHNSSNYVIPLSVADMDFPAASFIVDALAEANSRGIYGYTLLSDDWQEVTARWFLRRYRWSVDPRHIVFCPRVVQAVSLFLQNFTQPGDAIASLSPAYHPISHAVEVNHRRLLESPLRYCDGRYEIDIDHLETLFRQARCFILISPHNPTGTIWTKAVLQNIAALAEKYDVFIISDDVHADFIFNKSQHQVISTINPWVRQNSMICTSPAKTFNMAGLEVANIVIANDKYREKFSQAIIAAGIHNPGYFTVPAFLAAYSQGESWLEALTNYLAENRRWVLSFCQLHFPQWLPTSGGGTYMLWINYQRMQISEEQLRHWFVTLAGVEMSWGSGFGSEGQGFFRVNIAAPRALLVQAFERIYKTSPYTAGAISHG